jgi:hypothetical protein
METRDENPKPPLASPAGSELGLAALLIGLSLLVAAPIILILATLVWQFADQTPGIVLLHAWLARVGSALVGVACLSGVAVGGIAVRQARTTRMYRGLAVTGLLFALLGAAATAIAVWGLLNTTESRLLIFD